MSLLILLCPHQPKCRPLNFFMWDFRSILSIYPLRRLSYHHSFWSFSIFFPVFLFHFFFSKLTSLVFLSLHTTSMFRFFLFLLLKGSSLAKSFCFLKVFKKCKDVVLTGQHYFTLHYQLLYESLNVGVYLPVCTEASTLNKV